MKASPESIVRKIKRIRRIIYVWKTSHTFREACRRLRMRQGNLTAQISMMRLRGVTLQFFAHSTRQTEIDWAAMDRYAKTPFHLLKRP